MDAWTNVEVRWVAASVVAALLLWLVVRPLLCALRCMACTVCAPVRLSRRIVAV